MISTEARQEILALIRCGLTDREIASVVDTTHKTVAATRKMAKLLATITPDQTKRIITALRAGKPVGAIEVEVGVPQAAIKAIKRTIQLPRRRFSSAADKPCPTCGIRPNLCRPESRATKRPETASGRDLLILYRIAEDVIELESLGIIRHRLFRDIARRAEASLTQLNERTP